VDDSGRRLRKRIGLALGGGVVRGLAHVGVLSVLAEAGITIDYVAGTSVGAIVAAAYCLGWTIDEIEALADKFNWWRIISPVWPTQGLIGFDRLERFVRTQLGEPDFTDFKIPCTIVATDMAAGRQVCFSKGPVLTRLHASCAVPGIIKPVQIDGRIYCDGAVVNILPVSVVREMGADYVIGVDLMAFSIRRFLGPISYLWGALEILLQRSGGGHGSADCLIQPNLAGKTYLRFSKRRQLYALGRKAALGCLDQIRRDLS
jgi:NTE family protein